MNFKTMTDQEISDYVDSIMAMPSRRVIISPLVVAYDKFIGPQVPCMANIAKAHAFVMNCPDVYKQFLRYYRDSKYQETIPAQIQLVDNFMNEYFGLKKNDDLRREVNLQNPDLHSIDKYKGLDCAMCFERAILCHNLLKLLGHKSLVVTKNYHTYNLVQFMHSYYLYDPTNPSYGKVNDELYRFPSIRVVNIKRAQDYLIGKKSLRIDPYFYELTFHAKDVVVPNYEYSGLELQSPTNDQQS